MNTNFNKGDRVMKNVRLDKNDLLKKYSTAELIEYLNSIIDSEIEKKDEMNSDIINECVDWILELKGLRIELSETEIKKRVNAITGKSHIPKKRRFRFVYVAAIIVVMVFSIQSISLVAFGIDLLNVTKNTFFTFIGIEVEQNNFTHTASNTREYKTVEEFEEAEHINITIPIWLPGDIKIEFINYAYNFLEKQIYLNYNDDKTSLTIKLNSIISNTDGSEIYENNNVIFYVFKEANVIWWEYNGNFYNLTCGFNINEYAEKIIENIKNN